MHLGVLPPVKVGELGLQPEVQRPRREAVRLCVSGLRAFVLQGLRATQVLSQREIRELNYVSTAGVASLSGNLEMLSNS